MKFTEKVENVSGTEQTVRYTTFACGCEDATYSLPGHDDVTRESFCDQHRKVEG